MGFYQWIMSFFKPNKSKKEVPSLIMPQESVELIKKIENDKLNEMSQKLDVLSKNFVELNQLIHTIAKNQISILQAYRQQEEMIVAMATMQEEILYQFEQGKIMIVKPQSTNSEDAPPNKNKKNGQLN